MPLMKTKPTSPGRRSMVKVVNPDLHKGKPFAALVEPQFQKAGRNNNGHITTRHKGDRKSTRLNSSHSQQSRMPSSA